MLLHNLTDGLTKKKIDFRQNNRYDVTLFMWWGLKYGPWPKLLLIFDFDVDSAGIA